MATSFISPVHISKSVRTRSTYVQNSCFIGSRLAQHVPYRRAFSTSMKIGIYYDTTMGSTEEAAETIKEVFGDNATDPVGISEVDTSDLTQHELVFVGVPTWNTGAEAERNSTNWNSFLYDDLPLIDMSNVPFAVFGLGDSAGYGENFCDAIEELHDCFAKQGARMVGHSTTEYEFVESKSVRDGKFLGLLLDSTNFPEGTDELLKSWALSVVEEVGVTSLFEQ